MTASRHHLGVGGFIASGFGGSSYWRRKSSLEQPSSPYKRHRVHHLLSDKGSCLMCEALPVRY
jgi:hypothetical protein